jgi:cysteinyl-tRNA synthetase
MVKIINGLAADEKITKNTASITMPVLEEMTEILGLNLEKSTDEEIKSIFELLEKREIYRKNKQFNEADAIRDEISNMGIFLMDHKEKTLWMKKEKIKADF